MPIVIRYIHYIRKALPLALLSAFFCGYTSGVSNTHNIYDGGQKHISPPEAQDSILTLKEVEVSHKSTIQGATRHADGSVSIAAAEVTRGIHNLGEADVLRTSSMLPGISVASDYGAGISVAGSDYSHTLYSLDGATVFFPYHFGGIFSDFNTAHIARAEINTSASSRLSAQRSAGANVDAYTHSTGSERLAAAANIGMLASSLTVRTPISERFAASASARASYIDQVYGDMIKVSDSPASYGFSDYNLTLYCRPTSRDQIKANGLYSRDRASFVSDTYAMHTMMRWRNSAASLSYTHQGDNVDFRQILSLSGYRSTLSLGLDRMAFILPSSTRQLSAAGDACISECQSDIGYRVEYNSYKPQSLKSIGIDIGGSPAEAVDSWLIGIGGRKMLEVSDKSTIGLKLNLNTYKSASYHHLSLDPALTYSWSADRHRLSATIARATQYSHFTGLSDIGVASNFFLPANAALPPTVTYGIQADYATVLDRSVDIEGEIYYRHVENTAEYDGDVLSLLSDAYDPYQKIVDGKGYNTGGHIKVGYHRDGLSLWCAYSLAICRRKYADDPQKWTSAAYEPLHSLKSMAQWVTPNRKWQFNAYFTLASGRPYTPVRAIYMIGGNVLTEYGTRNSARLPMYHRLDLSATYYLPKVRLGSMEVRHFINISLINAYGHRNVEMQYFEFIHDDTDRIKLTQVSSLYRFLPSLSYTVEL